jgi:hypothetical protein
VAPTKSSALWRIAIGGGISSKADIDQIVAAGITHVIDMRAEFDDTGICRTWQSAMSFVATFTIV